MDVVSQSAVCLVQTSVVQDQLTHEPEACRNYIRRNEYSHSLPSKDSEIGPHCSLSPHPRPFLCLVNAAGREQVDGQESLGYHGKGKNDCERKEKRESWVWKNWDLRGNEGFLELSVHEEYEG